MLITDATAVTITTVIAGAESVPDLRHWGLAAAFAVAALAHVILTRPAEERRRAAQQRNHQVEHVDQTSIWIFSAAILLPAVLVAVLVVIVRGHRYLIARKPPGRWIFTSATVLLSALGVHGLARTADLHSRLLAGNWVDQAPTVVAAFAVAVAIYFLVQAIVIGAARALATGERSLPQLLGTRADNIFIVYTLLIAVLTTLVVVGSPIALGAMVAIAVRETRSVQRVGQLEHDSKQLAVDALHDPLTGLPNRRGFGPQAQLALVTCANLSQPAALVMTDLDHFRRWNDKLGHVGGDQVLQAVAGAIHAQIRGVDLICRYGGEEIAIMLPATTAADARTLGERIRTAVQALRTTVTKPAGGGEVNLGPESDGGVGLCTISIGIVAASHVDPAMQLPDLQELADQALYEAKHTGRNKVVIHRLGSDDQTHAPAAVPLG